MPGNSATHSPLTIHHSPLPSPFTIHHLNNSEASKHSDAWQFGNPFTIDHSPLTIHHSRLTIHHSRLTIHQKINAPGETDAFSDN
jgi:hypothetical protein